MLIILYGPKSYTGQGQFLKQEGAKISCFLKFFNYVYESLLLGLFLGVGIGSYRWVIKTYINN